MVSQPFREKPAMPDPIAEDLPTRDLEVVLREHLANTRDCGNRLKQLFADIAGFESYIGQIKHMEETGDRLTAEAYQALEALPYSGFIHLAEQFVNRLDDIVDGMDETARLVDFCTPRKTEPTAHELIASLLAMVDRLAAELAVYPANDPDSARDCREQLKRLEERADLLYHGWRKTQRRVNALPLVDENNWTEILGILEQTNDAAYHAALLLERMTKLRAREQNAPTQCAEHGGADRCD